MSQVLSAKLSLVRRKQALVSAGVGLSTFCILAVVFLTVEMLADWGIDWPWADGAGFSWTVRLFLLAIMGGVLGWILIKQVAVPLLFQADDDSLALAVERFEPGIDGRLIASVQLSRPRDMVAGTSLSLVRALIQQTEDLFGSYDFTRVVRTTELVRRGSLAGGLVLIGLIVFLICLPTSGTLLARAFLSDDAVPRRTNVEVKTGNISVARGESLNIVAEAHGIRPSGGELEVRNAGAIFTFPMPWVPATTNYIRKIDNVTAPFDYRVRLNDGISGFYHVSVIDRPEVLSMQSVQIYPQYIGLPDKPHLPGDLAVVAGSRLLVSIKSNKTLRPTTPQKFPFNHIHLSGSEKDYPLTVDPGDGKSAASVDVDGQRGIPLPPGTKGLSVFLVDQDGFETKDPTVYRVELLPDKPPRVKLLSGDWQEELITRAAIQHIDYNAVDDYGLGRLVLRFIVNEGDVQERPIPFDGHPTKLTGHVDLPMNSIPFPPASSAEDRPSIRYWLYVEDLNTVSTPDRKPGHGESDKYTLRVVSDEEKRQELMSKFGSIAADQVGAVANEQQEDSSNLGKVIIQGAEGSTTQPATRP